MASNSIESRAGTKQSDLISSVSAVLIAGIPVNKEQKQDVMERNSVVQITSHK